MAVYHALGEAGAARGVENDTGIVSGHLGKLETHCPPDIQSRVEIDYPLPVGIAIGQDHIDIQLRQQSVDQRKARCIANQYRGR